MSDKSKNTEKDKETSDEEMNVTNETEVTENEVVENEIVENNEVDALAESKEKYLRLYADFENFRRRTAKEKIETVLNATEGLMKDLLPVLDDFERAQKAMETSEDILAIKEGITLIYNKLNNTLAAKGLKAMESKGEIFNADLHESITQFDAGAENKGIVVDEIEKGYNLNDKVIRYAKVIVGS